MANFRVTNINDSGAGSLRDAIEQANLASGVDTIIFDASLSGQTITLTSGELTISDALTIKGLGADQLTISGNQSSRIFNVDDGTNNEIDVLIRNVTITNGEITGNDGDGGGIFNRENLTIKNSFITNNYAEDDGGAIRNDGTLTISGSYLGDNTSMGTSETSGGGAILNSTSATLNIRSTEFVNNEAINGGAIRNDGNLSVYSSYFADNFAELAGGAIITTINNNFERATSKIFTSFITSNEAGVSGGGLATPGITTATNTDITNNTAFQDSDVSIIFNVPLGGIVIPITGTFRLIGTNADDNIIGTDGKDFINGKGGNDTMTGGAGDDIYKVDSFGDIVVENADEGNDRVIATVDWILGDNLENLTLKGTAIEGTGNSLKNRIVGNAQNNFLAGEDGNDTLLGKLGDDQLTGGRGNDVLQGNEGIDILIGVNENEQLAGKGERDRLTGGTQQDTFVLGNSEQVFYDDGENDYALIQDFESGVDKIMLNGSINDYVFDDSPLGSINGQGIFLTRDGGMELIGIVRDATDLSLNINAFLFVDLPV